MTVRGTTVMSQRQEAEQVQVIQDPKLRIRMGLDDDAPGNLSSGRNQEQAGPFENIRMQQQAQGRVQEQELPSLRDIREKSGPAGLEKFIREYSRRREE